MKISSNVEIDTKVHKFVSFSLPPMPNPRFPLLVNIVNIECFSVSGKTKYI